VPPEAQGKEGTNIMRDELDARIWAAHHDRFADLIEKGAARLAARIGRIELGRGAAGQLLAVLLASSMSLAIISTSII
jgi:hypothetical protein